MTKMKPDPIEKSDIAVIGAGPVGLITALSLAKQCPYQITLFGIRLSNDELAKDTRTTAFMRSSLNLLANIDVLSESLKTAAPLVGLRMIDDTGSLFRAPDCQFQASELELDAFAQNIPNTDLVTILSQKILDNPSINWISDSNVTKIEPQQDSVILSYADNKYLEVKLCIGADGRGSPSRTAAAIKSKSWQYDQSAISCTLMHEKPHRGISTELHRNTGPLTLIPLSENHSSIVWSLPPPIAKTTAALPDEEFCIELSKASHKILGKIQKVGKRTAFPISCLKVDAFAANRIALVGEAAHALPPIGAQGLNLGVRDCADLVNSIDENVQNTPNQSDPGAKAILDAYNKSRKHDVWSRTYSTDMLNKSLLYQFLPLKAARYAGLHLIKQLSPLRKLMMQEGLGGISNPAPLLRDQNALGNG